MSPWLKYACALAAVVVATCAITGFTDTDAPTQEAPAPRVAPRVGRGVGINLAQVSYWASECPFVDAFKTSAPFWHQTSAQWELPEPMELRPDGYPARLAPGRMAGTLMFGGIGTAYPAGDYTCLYDGEGDIHFGFAGAILSATKGRIVVRVRPDDAGIYLKITRTDPEDPIRNIRFLLPGCSEDPAHPFNEAFLARWRGFQVLRFMDWQRTNDSEVVEWEQRTRVDAQTQGGALGVAPEYMVQLANELGADPWICIPHRASDGYVEQLARLFADRLDPQRRVYVEYTNEAWNGRFAQADFCRERGLAAGLSADPHTARLRYYAQRSGEVFAAWDKGFPDAQRTVRVLSVQNADPASARTVLEWRDAWRHADALAVAPYFGHELGDPATAAEIARLTPEQVLERCRRDVDATLRTAAIHVRTAKRHDLPLLAYEGGPHLAAHGGAENDEQLVALFAAASRAPAMGEIYGAYLRGWRALGGSLFVAFNSTGRDSKWGCWGLCEDYAPGSEDAPKYAAVRAFLREVAAERD